jgi:hypothetical protein
MRIERGQSTLLHRPRSRKSRKPNMLFRIFFAFIAILVDRSNVAIASGAPDWAVMISAEMPGYSMQGSGINLGVKHSEIRILTAWHLVKDSPTVTVTFPDGDRYKAYASNIRRIDKRDVALISIPSPFRKQPVAPLSRVPAYGTAFTGFGQTQNDVLDKVDGSLIYPRDDGTVFAACDKCTYGDSGGGIFTDDGHVFGLMVAITRFVDPTQPKILIVEPIPAAFLADVGVVDKR